MSKIINTLISLLYSHFNRLERDSAYIDAAFVGSILLYVNLASVFAIAGAVWQFASSQESTFAIFTNKFVWAAAYICLFAGLLRFRKRILAGERFDTGQQMSRVYFFAGYLLSSLILFASAVAALIAAN